MKKIIVYVVQTADNSGYVEKCRCFMHTIKGLFSKIRMMQINRFFIDVFRYLEIASIDRLVFGKRISYAHRKSLMRSVREILGSEVKEYGARPALEYYSLDLLKQACAQYAVPLDFVQVAVRDRGDDSVKCIIRQIYREVNALYVITTHEEDFTEFESEILMETGLLLQCVPSVPLKADFLFDSKQYRKENFSYIWGEKLLDNNLFETLFDVLGEQDYRNVGISCRYHTGRYPEKL